MAKKRLIKVGLILLSSVMLSGWFAASATSGARDCDSNAVIRCGTLTKAELSRALTSGGSGAHQSASTLRSLFARYGLTKSDIPHLREGRVTKSGLVYVGGRVVARNVYSMGRHYMPGSKRVSGVSYPLYIRHPSVSFRSNSLDAFVLMNSDGSMAVAVLKSCGNIIPGVGKRKPGHFIRIKKFNDLNGNGKWDTGEPPMANIRFRVTGPGGINKLVKTDTNGQVRVDHLPNGKYLVTEIVPTGWYSTTKSWKYFYHDRNQIIIFGNKRITKQELELKVIKFEDKNGNSTEDTDEIRLSGWQFNVSGPGGFLQVITTDANGEAHLTGLEPGTYTVTETMQSGWVNTTPLSITRGLTSDPATQTFIFGNKKEVQEQVQVHVIKFNDENGNGSQDGTEVRLEGWQFTVEGPGGFSQIITTDVNGHAYITGLPAGQYTITETLQTGWVNTTPLSVARDVTTDVNTQFFYFGNKQKQAQIQIHVLKFNDRDGNGSQGTGEERLSSWQFTVEGPGGFSQIITTDVNGHAYITGLPEGQYTITETQQSGWTNTTPLTVTRDVTTDPATQFFYYGNRQEQKELRIEVIKFNDKNGNTTQDVGEVRLEGWQFNVTGPGGFSQTITTDANGHAELTGLAPGTYTITEIMQTGWVNTTPLTITRDVSDDPTTQIFIFGNKQEGPPPPPPPPPGGEIEIPISLPITGPFDAGVAIIASMSLAGASVNWLKSKRLLKLAFRK